MTPETQKKIAELLKTCREEIASCESRLQKLLLSKKKVLELPENSQQEALLKQIQTLIDLLFERIRVRSEILLHAKKGTLFGHLQKVGDQV